MIIAAFACGAMLTSCGGGKKNEIFGNIPYLLEKRDSDLKAIDKRHTTITKKSKKERQKLMDKSRKKLEIEFQKIAGRTVPFSYSDEDLWFDVTSVVISEYGSHFIIRAVANRNVEAAFWTAPHVFAFDYLAKDGSVITSNTVSVEGRALNSGESLIQKYSDNDFIVVNLYFEPYRKMRDFAGIRFRNVQKWR